MNTKLFIKKIINISKKMEEKHLLQKEQINCGIYTHILEYYSDNKKNYSSHNNN